MEGYKLISLLKFYNKKNIVIEMGVNLKGGKFIRGRIIRLKRFFRRYIILQNDGDTQIKIFIEDIIPSTIIPVDFLQDKEKNKKNKKSRSPISPKLRFDVLRRDKYVCQYCGACGPDVELEVDHVIPVSRGGTDDIDNLKTTCFDCNRGKGDIV